MNFVIDSILNADKEINGVACCDAQGLCIAANGDISPEISGFCTKLATTALSLAPQNEKPVICIETENRTILIKKQSEITIAISKKKASS